MCINYFSLILHAALQKLNNLTTLEYVCRKRNDLKTHREYVHIYKYIYRIVFFVDRFTFSS